MRAALGALVVVACAAHAEPVVDAEATFAYDSNVTRAPAGADVRGDGYAHVRTAAGWRFAPADDDTVELGGGLRGSAHHRFRGLDVVALEARAAWRRKLGLGLAAPWLAAIATLASEDYRDDTRDSATLGLVLEAGRRFDATLDGSIGYAYDHRRARHDDPAVPGVSGRVRDISGQAAFARIGWAPDERWLVDAAYTVRRGDVVSTTRPNVDIFLASSAIAASPTFGPDFFDYRLRATTQSATTRLSYALGSRSSLEFGYVLGLTRAAHGLDYRNHLVSATWLYRN